MPDSPSGNVALLDKGHVLCMEDTKRDVIESDFYKMYCTFRKLNNGKMYSTDAEKREEFAARYNNFMLDHPDLITDSRFRTAERIYNNTRNRAARLRKTLKIWLKAGPLYFVTLTFRDDVFAATSTATRRQYVSRYLSRLDALYSANIDFGAINEREHYHAVICTRGDLVSHSGRADNGQIFERFEIQDEWERRFGFMNVQGPIRQDECFGDDKAIAKYITKLSNHALKASGKQYNLLYSKKVPEWAEPVIYTGNKYMYNQKEYLL